jgi:hypothetical protein
MIGRSNYRGTCEVLLYSTFHTTKLRDVKKDLSELCRSYDGPPLDELHEVDELN